MPSPYESLEQTRWVSAPGDGGCSPGCFEWCYTTLRYCSTLVTAEILIRRLKIGWQLEISLCGHRERQRVSEGADPKGTPPPGPRTAGGRAGLPSAPAAARRQPVLGRGVVRGRRSQRHPGTLLPALLRRRAAGSGFSSVFARKFWGKPSSPPRPRCQPGLLPSSGAAIPAPAGLPLPRRRPRRGRFPHRRLPPGTQHRPPPPRNGTASGRGGRRTGEGRTPSEGRPGRPEMPGRLEDGEGELPPEEGARAGQGGGSSATWIRFLCLRRSAMLSPSAPPVTWAGPGLGGGWGRRPRERRREPAEGREGRASLSPSQRPPQPAAAAAPRLASALSPGGGGFWGNNGWAAPVQRHRRPPGWAAVGPHCSSVVNEKLPAGEKQPLLLLCPGLAPPCSGPSV